MQFKSNHRHENCSTIACKYILANMNGPQVEVDEDIDYVAQAVADMSVATTGPPSSASVSSLPSPPPQRKSAAAAAVAAPVEDVS